MWLPSLASQLTTRPAPPPLSPSRGEYSEGHPISFQPRYQAQQLTGAALFVPTPVNETACSTPFWKDKLSEACIYWKNYRRWKQNGKLENTANIEISQSSFLGHTKKRIHSPFAVITIRITCIFIGVFMFFSCVLLLLCEHIVNFRALVMFTQSRLLRI